MARKARGETRATPLVAKKKDRGRRECCSLAEFVTVERYIIPLKGTQIGATGGSSFTCHICHKTRAESARVIYSWLYTDRRESTNECHSANIRRSSSILDIDKSVSWHKAKSKSLT